MTARKARNYAAYGVERLGGWTAHYGPPGGNIRSISDDHGQDIIYPTQSDARDAAAHRLIEVLNSAMDGLKRGKLTIDRITGEELGGLIASAELKPKDFADLVGLRYDGLRRQLLGEVPVSGPVQLVAYLLNESDDALDIARETQPEEDTQ